MTTRSKRRSAKFSQLLDISLFWVENRHLVTFGKTKRFRKQVLRILEKCPTRESLWENRTLILDWNLLDLEDLERCFFFQEKFSFLIQENTHKRVPRFFQSLWKQSCRIIQEYLGTKMCEHCHLQYMGEDYYPCKSCRLYTCELCFESKTRIFQSGSNCPYHYWGFCDDCTYHYIRCQEV